MSQHSVLIELAGETLPVSINFVKRKSISLQVIDKQIHVKAPLFLSQPQALSFIKSKQRWLQTQITKQQSLATRTLFYEDGDKFLYLGNPFFLRITRGAHYNLSLEEQLNTLHITVPYRVKSQQEYVKTKFKQFIYQQAESIISPQFALIEQSTQLIAKSLHFKIYKRRWGCCDSKGNITLNPLLISCPIKVIKCVIKHELSHLKHLNHSSAFWKLNNALCGTCKQSDAWLYQHQKTIQL